MTRILRQSSSGVPEPRIRGKRVYGTMSLPAQRGGGSERMIELSQMEARERQALVRMPELQFLQRRFGWEGKK